MVENVGRRNVYIKQRNGGMKSWRNGNNGRNNDVITASATHQRHRHHIGNNNVSVTASAYGVMYNVESK